MSLDTEFAKYINDLESSNLATALQEGGDMYDILLAITRLYNEEYRVEFDFDPTREETKLFNCTLTVDYADEEATIQVATGNGSCAEVALLSAAVQMKALIDPEVRLDIVRGYEMMQKRNAVA